MDGTIIDSTPAIIKYWLQMGENIGVDGNGTLNTDLYHCTSEGDQRRPPHGQILTNSVAQRYSKHHTEDGA
jgi:beta-phosphoglucomutase-like phosphatase (HAD superfamily)